MSLRRDGRLFCLFNTEVTHGISYGMVSIVHFKVALKLKAILFIMNTYNLTLKKIFCPNLYDLASFFHGKEYFKKSANNQTNVLDT